jgi:hypothetical protein
MAHAPPKKWISVRLKKKKGKKAGEMMMPLLMPAG